MFVVPALLSLQANLRIDHNDAIPDSVIPATIQKSGCGEPGEYMMIPIKFVGDQEFAREKMGPLGSQLISSLLGEAKCVLKIFHGFSKQFVK